MSFGAPAYLALLALALAAAAALARWALWREGVRARFGRQAASRLPAYAPAILLLSAGALAAVAAARPQWGEREIPVERRGVDVAIVLDVSLSMQAADAVPSRLVVAQEEAAALLDRMSGDRAGLVIFAGKPFLRSPLTSDLAALREIVAGAGDELGLVPPGSDLTEAIGVAVELLQGAETQTRIMLIVSDGEDREGGVERAIDDARAAGVRVYTAGVGTAVGAQVIDVDRETGVATPRVDASGAPVLTRLDADALRRMADAGGGRYVDATASGALAALAPEFADLGRTTFGRESAAEPLERFRIFASAALALAVAATLWPLLDALGRRAARAVPFLGAGLLAGAVCVSGASQANRRGNERYERGEYAGAVDAYRTAQALRPGAPEPLHNAANAFDRDGQYASAVDEAQRGLQGADRGRDALLAYVLGGAYARSQRFHDALDAYKRALLADPEDADTKHNLEVVIRLLTPQPGTPTPVIDEPPFTPPPGDGSPSPGETTPEPGGTPEGTPVAGTPQPEQDLGELSPEELLRLLDDALKGIDEEFTTEEALRVLELLEAENRGQLEHPASAGPGLPDY